MFPNFQGIWIKWLTAHMTSDLGFVAQSLDHWDFEFNSLSKAE